MCHLDLCAALLKSSPEMPSRITYRRHWVCHLLFGDLSVDNSQKHSIECFEYLPWQPRRVICKIHCESLSSSYSGPGCLWLTCSSYRPVMLVPLHVAVRVLRTDSHKVCLWLGFSETFSSVLRWTKTQELWYPRCWGGAHASVSPRPHKCGWVHRHAIFCNLL